MNDTHFEMFRIRSVLFVDDNLYLVNDLTRSSRIFSLGKSSPCSEKHVSDKEALLCCCWLTCILCVLWWYIHFPDSSSASKNCMFVWLFEKTFQYFFFLMSEMVRIKAFIIPFSFCVKLMFKLERKWEPWQFR